MQLFFVVFVLQVALEGLITKNCSGYLSMIVKLLYFGCSLKYINILHNFVTLNLNLSTDKYIRDAEQDIKLKKRDFKI